MANTKPVSWRTVFLGFGALASIVLVATLAQVAPIGAPPITRPTGRTAATTTSLDKTGATGCRIKTDTAIYCSLGRSAVIAFDTYGADVDLMKQSNNIYLIHSAGCAFVTRSAKVLEISHGRVPFTNGWAGVTTVLLNGKYDGFISDEYLEGDCERYKPPTFRLGSSSPETVP